MDKPKQDGVERAIRKAQKAKKDRHQAMKVLPQITAFVKAKVPMLAETMKAQEARNMDEQHCQITWQMYGKRPKIRDSWQFVLMMQQSLTDQLEAKGFSHVKVEGRSRDSLFLIDWDKPLN